MLLPDGTKQLQLSRNQYEDIGAALKKFFQRTKCDSALIVDESGLLISQYGGIDAASLTVLATLAAANYAATAQMAILLGENSAFENQYHEGEKQNLYITAINSSFYLVTIFSSTSLGLIRVACEGTVKTLDEITNRPITTSEETAQKSVQFQDVSKNDFREELSSRLDSLLTKTTGTGETVKSG